MTTSTNFFDAIETILIVDLEATCWNDRPQSVDVMEIIEFGCAVATLDGAVHYGFSQLVKPQINPDLSAYCQSLTSITQDMVDTAPVYAEAVKNVNEILREMKFDAWCSWGQYDFNQLAVEKKRYGIAPNFTQHPHINLKAVWQATPGRRRKGGLGRALASLGFEFDGKHHRGEDDARNIARILPFLVPHAVQDLP